jgi:hypothetical protein
MMPTLKKILTALSLLLCLATIAFWIAGNWNLFYVYYRAGDLAAATRTDYGIVLRANAVQCEKLTYEGPADPLSNYGSFVMLHGTNTPRWTCGRSSEAELAELQSYMLSSSDVAVNRREPESAILGIGYGREMHTNIHGRFDGVPIVPFYHHALSFIVLPYWSLMALFGAAPALAALGAARRFHRKTKPNLCLKCGYDIHASENRCPECGTPIPTANRSGILSPMQAAAH